MKTIPFKEQTSVAAKDQPQYNSMPVRIDPNDKHGSVVSCWHLSPWERLKVLITGKVWMNLMMFRDTNGKINPITPSRLTVHKSEVVFDAPLIGINFDVLQRGLREKVAEFPDDTDMIIVIHDDLYNSKGVDIAVTEERLGGVNIVPYSVAKEYLSLPAEFFTDNFIITETYYKP